MDWVANRTYSFNSIVRALDNKRNKVKDNAHYSVLRADKVEKVLIIGGGNSVLEHQEAIKEYIHNNPDMPLLLLRLGMQLYIMKLLIRNIIVWWEMKPNDCRKI